MRCLRLAVLAGVAALLAACSGTSGEPAAATQASGVDGTQYCPAMREALAWKNGRLASGEVNGAEIWIAIAEMHRRTADLAPPEISHDIETIIEVAERTGQAERQSAADGELLRVARPRLELWIDAQCGFDVDFREL